MGGGSGFLAGLSGESATIPRLSSHKVGRKQNSPPRLGGVAAAKPRTGWSNKWFLKAEIVMTLLESCASVAIVSTMVVFSAPSLIRAREHYQLDAVARQVAGKMQSARIKAISRNRDCRVRVASRRSVV